jgi:cholest-4-en-3-one 26-monooxygenase
LEFNLYDPDLFVPSVPHDEFDWMRSNAPVHFNPDPAPGFWSLTRYADVVAASKNHKVFSSAHGTNIEDPTSGVELMMINMDPPQHTKLRTLVSKGFHPKMIARIEAHVRDITTQIIDGVAKRGECDFVVDIAAQLPLEVIAEMIGIPPEDRHKIFEWSNTMIGGQGGDAEYSSTFEEATAAAMEMWAYANQLAEIRTHEPREDLTSTLIHAEVDGVKLTEVEFDMFFLLLAVAGNETTRNLISGGMQALMENPDQQQRLVAIPSLIPTGVEEMLRWVVPVMHFRRTLTQDVELHGVPMKAGDKVLLWYNAANRDERVFGEPHTFDVTRDPNPHLTFGGGGPHFCLGFSLAQLEIRVMFEELLRRLPDMRIAGPVSRLRSVFINGVKHIPVQFTPERS